MVYKPGDSLSLCIDAKGNTYLATVAPVNDLSDPAIGSVNALLSSLGKALKK